MKLIFDTRFYTYKEAADLLEVNETTIRNRIRTKELIPVRIGMQTFISEYEIRRYLGIPIIGQPQPQHGGQDEQQTIDKPNGQEGQL